MYVTVSPGGTVTFRYDYRLNGRRETLIPPMLEAFIAGGAGVRARQGDGNRPSSREAVPKGVKFGYVAIVVSRLRLEPPYQIDLCLEKL